jgi:hypothetical protein
VSTRGEKVHRLLGIITDIEWVRVAQVERVPKQGEIVTASETWEEPAGSRLEHLSRSMSLG